MRFISLKTKITVLMVSVSTLTTGFLGVYLVWKSYQSLRLQAQQSQLALAKTFAWQVNTGLSGAFQAVEILSKRPETVNLDKKELVREMTVVTAATELIENLILLRPDGRLFAQSFSVIDPKDMPPKTYFLENIRRANELRGSVLVDVYKTHSGNLGMAFTTPVFRGRELIGVLSGIMYLPHHTIGNLETARIGKTGYAYLVNQEGVAIVHPDRAKLLENLSDNPAVKAVLNQEEGVIQFRNPAGQEILAAFAPVKTGTWGVVVQQPAEECYEPARRMLKFMSLFLTMTMAVSILLALSLSERVVRPIMELADQVRRYESGKGTLRSLENIKPTDEVGILRHSLGRMALTNQTQTREREKAHARTLAAERKLAEAERLATIGQFSAGLAHELNNPLTVILGSSQVAQGSRGKELRNWLNQIQKEAERCRRLVSDLLNFAKPIHLKIRRIDLIDLLKETWNQIPLAGQSYRLKFKPFLFRALVDPDRFKQVFVNLLRNAVESMPKGGEVQVEFKKMKGRVQVSIIDGGKGIRKSDIPKLFRLFFTTKPNGTGLGLAIARAILRAHQGIISIESNKRRGTKIKLEWPGT